MRFFGIFSFYVLYSTLFHLPPLRVHCVGGCWDRTQDSCDYGIGCQTLYNHSARSHLIWNLKPKSLSYPTWINGAVGWLRVLAPWWGIGTPVGRGGGPGSRGGRSGSGGGRSGRRRRGLGLAGTAAAAASRGRHPRLRVGCVALQVNTGNV
jgi:hypothetical protein